MDYLQTKHGQSNSEAKQERIKTGGEHMEVRTIPKRRNRIHPSSKEKPDYFTSVDDALREEILKGKDHEPTVIPASSAPVKIEVKAHKDSEKKLRVAGYCRVSTGNLEQQSSILNQREHYEAYIRSNPDWEYAGVYWEADVSGTKAYNRPELQRLISDCRKGLIDLILTKSISRFSRSTTDCLELVRTLTALGVHIRFEKENINTGTMESEFLLTLFSSFAEEESRSISANETWAKRKQFANGTYRYSIAPFGYTLQNGTFIVNQEQVPVVKEIFSSVLRGKGTSMIAKELNEKGIPTGTKRNDGSPGIWTDYMVRGIVKNVVYIGDVLCQKTFHEHFKLMINYGERQQYYNESHHEAIIDRETFEAANEAVRQRGREKGNLPKDRQLRNNPHTNRYAFSGRLTCACCGGKMKRVKQKLQDGYRIHWSCLTHIGDKEKCHMKREQEDSIRNAFCTMVNKLSQYSDFILTGYIEDLRAEEAEGNEEMIVSLEEELKTVESEKHRLSLLLSKGCGEPVSYRKKLLEIEARLNEIRAELKALHGDSEKTGAVKELIGMLKRGTDDPDVFFTQICDGASVKTGEYVIFHLKCGLDLKEPLDYRRCRVKNNR